MVELIASETMSYLSASFSVIDDQLVSTSYSFRVKGDPRRTLWRRKASGQIVDGSTILMTYPTIYLNNDGSLRSQGTTKASYIRFEK